MFSNKGEYPLMKAGTKKYMLRSTIASYVRRKACFDGVVRWPTARSSYEAIAMSR